MNKKFFAALASATMAFTASGSIAVFADDFVEEKTPIVDGNVTPLPATVKWNKDNFGALVKEESTAFTGFKGTLKEDEEVETAALAEVTGITLTDKTNGEIKGLEYFTKLGSFNDTNATAVTNETLDFSSNTALTTLTVNSANKLTKLVLPNSTKTEDELDKYSLTTLDLQKTKLTALDLSVYDELTSVTVKNNANLAAVTLEKGTSKAKVELNKLDLSHNSLETVDLDYFHIKKDGTLDLSHNHIGALDLSKTTSHSNATITLGNQTFYVSEKFGTANLKETFENFDAKKVTDPTDSKKYNKENGVLTLEKDETGYKYDTGKGELDVKLIKANPMNRLYNPNSGEHFYTADLDEKEALVKLGWNDEGYGWVAPKFIEEKDVTTNTDQPVYRLYNPNAGDHHYTKDATEKETLMTYGWKYEGIGWYSAESTTDQKAKVDVYRQYNPFANGAGSHNYTTDKAENDYLVSLGWTPEGTAWYAYR